MRARVRGGGREREGEKRVRSKGDCILRWRNASDAGKIEGNRERGGAREEREKT